METQRNIDERIDKMRTLFSRVQNTPKAMWMILDEADRRGHYQSKSKRPRNLSQTIYMNHKKN
jgi:hypothetical protein